MRPKRTMILQIAFVFLMAFAGMANNTEVVAQPVGTIIMYGSNADPSGSGWFICDGTALSRTVYSNLFSRIGTTYGVGDGSTTFNLPDFRGRFAMGKSASGTGSTLGSSGGTIDHVHSVDPPNTTSGGPSAVVVSATPLLGSRPTDTHTHDVNIAAFNSASANPPFLTVNYIIKY